MDLRTPLMLKKNDKKNIPNSSFGSLKQHWIHAHLCKILRDVHFSYYAIKVLEGR